MVTKTPTSTLWSRSLLLRLLVTVTLLGFLVATTGIDSLTERILGLRLAWVCLTALCLLVLLVLGGFNAWLLLRAIRPVAFATFFPNYLYAWAVGLVTPGQLGDASMVLFLKRAGIATHQSSAAYTLNKTITICVLSVVSCFGANLLLPGVNAIWFLLGPVIAAGVALAGLGLLWRMARSSALAERVQQRIHQAMRELLIFKSKWHVLALNIALTIINWLAQSVCFFVVFRSVGEWVGWPMIAVIPVLAILVGFIPISLGGLGAVECMAAYLFALIGVETSSVLAAYFLLRVTNYMLAGLVLLSSVHNTSVACKRSAA